MIPRSIKNVLQQRTMNRNKLFGKLVDEGISSVAKRQDKTVAAVEMEVAEQLGYSPHTVQHWKRGNLPAQEDQVAYLVRYCVQQGRVDRPWAQSLLTQARYGDTAALLEQLFSGSPASALTRLFLCYQRGSVLDDRIALRVAQALSLRHAVFFDQEAWLSSAQAARIHAQLSQADYMAVFVSDEAMRSELLLTQVELAHEVQQRQHGRPMLLPIRLPGAAPLTPDLHCHLGELRWSYWYPELVGKATGESTGESTEEAESERLIGELERALAGDALPLTYAELPAPLASSITRSPPLAASVPTVPAPWPTAQPAPLEMPEGTMAPDSAFYMVREEDTIALGAIARQGVTITIKGPRQVGKSSLLIRVREAAERAGKTLVFLDFQLLKPVLHDADAFFRYFATLIGYQLRVEDRTQDYWQLPLPNPFRCTEYVGRYLVGALERPLLLAMDEVDSVFDTEFRTDFFGMLRAWHNNRAFDMAWRKVDLALVTSTEPYYFIDNLNQSPFNVGEVIELQPLSVAQVVDLNRRHGEPLPQAQAGQLAVLVHGHPYLVRRALYLVASGRIAATDLFAGAVEESGPFGDHLRSLLTRLHAKPELIEGLRQVLRSQSCPNDLFFRLRGAGLVRREQQHVLPNSPLYATFFREHFHD